MFAFILAVFLFNLIFMCFLYLMRRTIAITTPVLIMTALVAFLCTITFPYMIAILDYSQIIVIFCSIILFFSILLALADKKYPAPTFDAGVENLSNVERKQKDDLNATKEIPTVEKAPTETGHQLPDQNAAAVKSVDTDQIPCFTRELETAAAENRETASPQSESKQPSHEVMDPSPDGTDNKTGSPDNLEVIDHVEITIQEPEFIQPAHEEADSSPDVTNNKTPSPENSKVTGHNEVMEQEHNEQVPDVKTTPEPAAIAIIEENEDTPPDGNHLIADLTSTEVAKPDSGLIEMNATNMNNYIDLGFANKQNGNYMGAATTFFKVLKMQPEPKLAALLALEISDIYRKAGQFWQATEILNTLLKCRRAELDIEKVKGLELKINHLQELLKKGG